MASTLRLPTDLERTLDDYCAATGAAKSRVTVLALRSYLGERTPALPVQPSQDAEIVAELVEAFDATLVEDA